MESELPVLLYLFSLALAAIAIGSVGRLCNTQRAVQIPDHAAPDRNTSQTTP